jgi:hypothetical protein
MVMKDDGFDRIARRSTRMKRHTLRSALVVASLALGVAASAQTISVESVPGHGQYLFVKASFGGGPFVNTHSHTIGSGTIAVRMVQDGGDWLPNPPHSFTEFIGPVPAGAYTVNVVIERPFASLDPLTRQFAIDVPPPPSLASYARLERVSGDRQIVVDSRTPPAPFQVRAVDAEGHPVAGVQLLIGPSASTEAALLQDEFGYRGFNTRFLSRYTWFGMPDAKYLATTGTDGIATAQGDLWDVPPSSSIVGAARWPEPGAATFFSTVITEKRPAINPSVVVEYVHKDLGHYFNTLVAAEIDLLDAGHFAGWTRSIGSFIAYATAQDAPADAMPVCRFFSSLYTSHFYTADPDECDAVVSKWPDVWLLETRAAFYIQVPNRTTGYCPVGTQPVYRLYNNRPGPNHRYVTDRALRDDMVRAGWIAEGFGADVVIMCTPR